MVVDTSNTQMEEEEDEFCIPPPPLTAFVANEDGSRLIITRIVNENFKSYAGIQELGPFHKYFTSILGPNGSGKSNVIDSMLFVFGYRASRLRSKKISELLHVSNEHGKKTSCTVTVHFACMKDIPDVPDDYELVPGSEFYISRTGNADNSSHYTISGRRCQFKEVSEKLRNYGIDLVHNRFLILQGEVEQISLMKPKGDEHNTGMLEYLEDIIGSSRFKEPIEKCTIKVQDLGEVRDTKRASCRLAQTDLDAMQEPMEKALRYVQAENIITLLNSQVLQKNINMTEVEKQAKAEMLRKTDEEMKTLKKNIQGKKLEMQNLEKSQKEELQELERVTLLKEQMKDDFETRKRRDITLQHEVERNNKKRKELAKSLASDENKRISLAKVPSQHEETINDLEVKEGELEEERQEAVQNEARVIKSIEKDTAELQAEKEELQKEHSVVIKTVDAARAKYENSRTDLSLYTSESQKLEQLKQKLTEINNLLESRSKEAKDLEKDIAAVARVVLDDQNQVAKLRNEAQVLEQERRKHHINVEEARSSMQSKRSRGKVLDALMQAKQRGELPGLIGRLGDMGGIDLKYDVAVSTAAPGLDHIIVDNTDTAEACILYLKKHNIGRATFISLAHQEHFRKTYTRPFQAPENLPRLFDQVHVPDDRLRPAFYYVMRDTLIATDLDQATRVGFGATRYRVVTLTGELVEMVGTMSGGGKTQYRGRMGRTADNTRDVVAPQEMKRMEEVLEELTQKLTDLRRNIAAVEERMAQNNAELDAKRNHLSKITLEIKTGTNSESAVRNQIKAQQAQVKEDANHLSKLQKALEVAQRKMAEAEEKANEVDMRVKKVHTSIVAKTASRVEGVQKKLKDVLAKLQKVRDEKMKLRVAVTTAARNLANCEKRIAAAKQEIEDCVERIKASAAEIQSNEEAAKNTLAEFEEIDGRLTTLTVNNAEYKIKQQKLFEEETAMKSREIDLREELSRARSEYEHRVAKIAQAKKKLKSLKLAEEPFVDRQPELKEFTPQELNEMDIEDLINQLKEAEESLPRERPNLGAITEYQKLRKIFTDREKDLADASDRFNRYKQTLDNMKETRFMEFKQGFQVITIKVRECYQMLAEGGDAELELVNSMDPFMDGVKFTVRPPKKSWKEIQFLSGGEKTLSSLSLIFALHYYKPTPLYFMDEIDSALDWKNTAIVGHYLKEQTKNAQFIVVTLREMMYEIVDLLVGIYKTNNCTKSITVAPHRLCTPEEDSGSNEDVGAMLT